MLHQRVVGAFRLTFCLWVVGDGHSMVNFEPLDKFAGEAFRNSRVSISNDALLK